jgi:hypothetical protein
MSRLRNSPKRGLRTLKAEAVQVQVQMVLSYQTTLNLVYRLFSVRIGWWSQHRFECLDFPPPRSPAAFAADVNQISVGMSHVLAVQGRFIPAQSHERQNYDKGNRRKR